MPHDKEVRDCMIPIERFPYVYEDQPLREAIKTLRTGNEIGRSIEARLVLVVNRAFELVGLLTMRGILKGLERRYSGRKDMPFEAFAKPVFWKGLFRVGVREEAEKPVSEVMQPIRVTIGVDEPLIKAAFLMIEEGVGKIPVLDGIRPVGVIRLTEIFNEITRLLDE